MIFRPINRMVYRQEPWQIVVNMQHSMLWFVPNSETTKFANTTDVIKINVNNNIYYANGEKHSEMPLMLIYKGRLEQVLQQNWKVE